MQIYDIMQIIIQSMLLNTPRLKQYIAIFQADHLFSSYARVHVF